MKRYLKAHTQPQSTSLVFFFLLSLSTMSAYLRRPSIAGDDLVFICEDAVWHTKWCGAQDKREREKQARHIRTHTRTHSHGRWWKRDIGVCKTGMRLQVSTATETKKKKRREEKKVL